MIDRDRAKAITDQILGLSSADEAELDLRGGTSSNLRFARNSPTTSGSHDDLEVTITSVFGTRSGSVTVNQLDDATLREAVARSEAMARRAPEDEEHMPALGPQEYLPVDAFSQDTAEHGAEFLVECADASIEQARARGLVAAGFAEVEAGFSCKATSAGLFGYHRQTSVYLSQTMRTQDGAGSGWSSASSHRRSDIDAAAMARQAMDKARASVGPRPLEPGAYPTILEPACVANLLAMLVPNMDARRADEGRSFFTKPGGGTRAGERVFSESVTIRTAPQDPSAPALPWGEDGLPQRARALVDAGVVQTLPSSRYWAKKTDREPVPDPSNIIMEGGQGTVADLIARTERGVLVTSLWYMRYVDPRSLLFTGLTRDGLFWIQDGEIAHPIQNFRWNDSPISIFSKVEALSRPERIPPRPRRSNNIVVPAVKVSAFHFSSVSDAI